MTTVSQERSTIDTTQDHVSRTRSPGPGLFYSLRQGVGAVLMLLYWPISVISGLVGTWLVFATLQSAFGWGWTLASVLIFPVTYLLTPLYAWFARHELIPAMVVYGGGVTGWLCNFLACVIIPPLDGKSERARKQNTAGSPTPRIGAQMHPTSAFAEFGPIVDPSTAESLGSGDGARPDLSPEAKALYAELGIEPPRADIDEPLDKTAYLNRKRTLTQAPEKGNLSRRQGSSLREADIAFATHTVSEKQRVYPLRRYWARMLDMSLYGYTAFCAATIVKFIVALCVAYAQQHNGSNSDQNIAAVQNQLGVFLAFAFIALWWFIEAFNLSVFGATLGKLLFGISVRQTNGEKLTFNQSLGRGFKIWWRGLGLSLPIVSYCTLPHAYGVLSKTGSTSWDTEGNYVVVHKPIGITRLIFCLLLSIPTTVSFWLLQMANSRPHY